MYKTLYKQGMRIPCLLVFLLLSSEARASEAQTQADEIIHCAGTAAYAQRYYEGTPDLERSSKIAEMHGKTGLVTAPYLLLKEKVFTTEKDALDYVLKGMAASHNELKQYFKEHSPDETHDEILRRVTECKLIYPAQLELYKEMVRIAGKPIVEADRSVTTNDKLYILK